MNYKIHHKTIENQKLLPLDFQNDKNQQDRTFVNQLIEIKYTEGNEFSPIGDKCRMSNNFFNQDNYYQTLQYQEENSNPKQQMNNNNKIIIRKKINSLQDQPDSLLELKYDSKTLQFPTNKTIDILLNKRPQLNTYFSIVTSDKNEHRKVVKKTQQNCKQSKQSQSSNTGDSMLKPTIYVQNYFTPLVNPTLIHNLQPPISYASNPATLPIIPLDIPRINLQTLRVLQQCTKQIQTLNPCFQYVSTDDWGGILRRKNTIHVINKPMYEIEVHSNNRILQRVSKRASLQNNNAKSQDSIMNRMLNRKSTEVKVRQTLRSQQNEGRIALQYMQVNDRFLAIKRTEKIKFQNPIKNNQIN